MDECTNNILEVNNMDRYLFRQEGGFVKLFFSRNALKNCLDLACGYGRFSRLITPVVPRVYSMDLDKEKLISINSNPALSTIFTVYGNANYLPFKNGSLDCIVCVQCVELFNDDIGEFFKECNDALKTNGFLLFSNANKGSYKKIIHMLMSNHRHQFYRYTYNDTIKSLENKGFKIISTVGYNWIPFDRSSNSPLIDLFERIEAELGLHRLASVSPWVFFVVQKIESNRGDAGV